MNRFSRRVADSIQNRESLTFSGVRLSSVSEGEQNFLNVMLNALGAQMFSEKIAEHTRRGLVDALEREGRMHSLAYGYRKVEGRKGAREINPETAPIVLRIFEEAANGKSDDDIARELNRDGVPAPHGGIWYAYHDPRRGQVRRGPAAQDDLRRYCHLRAHREPPAP